VVQVAANTLYMQKRVSGGQDWQFHLLPLFSYGENPGGYFWNVFFGLAGYSRDVPMRLQMAAGWKPGDSASAALWVVGELGGAATVGDVWNDGFDATITVTTPADATVGTGRISVPRGARTFRLAITPSQPLVPGEYVIRIGARAGPASIPSRETTHLTIPASPDSTGALFVRRGQSTGNRDVPTADLRFRRIEQIRVEIPTSSSDPVAARLLDRTGRPLAVPVTAALRDDTDGSKWMTAQLALVSLFQRFAARAPLTELGYAGIELGHLVRLPPLQWRGGPVDQTDQLVDRGHHVGPGAVEPVR